MFEQVPKVTLTDTCFQRSAKHFLHRNSAGKSLGSAATKQDKVPANLQPQAEVQPAVAPARPPAESLCHLPLGLATYLQTSGEASSTEAAVAADEKASLMAVCTTSEPKTGHSDNGGASVDGEVHDLHVAKASPRVCV